MIISRVVDGFIEVIRGTLEGYAMISKVVHDPDMTYQVPLRDSVSLDETLQRAGKKDWLLLSWAREYLRPTEEQGRLFTMGKKLAKMPEGYEFRMRYVDLVLSLQFLSPSEETIEAVEETLLCFPPEGPFDYTVDAIDSGPFSGSIKQWGVTGMSRVATESFGSLTSLQANATVGCIVPLLKRRVKLIAKVNTELVPVGHERMAEIQRGEI